MSNDNKKITNVLIITDQLEQIDLIEKSLKQSLLLNTHKSNDITDVKKILSHENINLILIDDDSSTIGCGSVRNAVKDLRMLTPILQLVHAEQEQPVSYFIKNGATIVCPSDDADAILHNSELLISYLKNQHTVSTDSSIIDNFQQKFEDLYQGLADPVCYLQDGVFVDCNPAFLRSFEVSDREELDELTILNFVSRTAQTDFKNHLRKATRRDLSASPVIFTMQTKLGNEAEYVIMSKPATFNNEDVVQMYMRSTAEGGGGGASLYDETTGLANKEQMGFYLEQKIKQSETQKEEAVLAYLFIKNYRDVWATDGFFEAEKFIKAVAHFIRKDLPAHTEVSRYTDDGLLMYIPHVTEKEAERQLNDLVKGLDSVTPEGMERMVEPVCYIGYHAIDPSHEYHNQISTIFRTARNASASESSSRVNQPTNAEVNKKDTKRLEDLQNTLKEDRIQMRFQPIASFDPDGKQRYRERITLLDEENHPMDLGIMVNVAERYELMHRIDKWKMNLLFEKLLATDISHREPMQIFIAISADSLKNKPFVDWLANQLQDTGLSGEHFVFELNPDIVQNAYTGALAFATAMREKGAKIAITKIASLTNDQKRIITDIKPDIIKLDLREVSTLDDTEEPEVMEEILHHANECNALLIAEYLESPAQLSSIWPYDIKLIQGDGMTPLLDEMNFDFNDFAI